jgi:hypothetical protein
LTKCEPTFPRNSNNVLGQPRVFRSLRDDKKVALGGHKQLAERDKLPGTRPHVPGLNRFE